MKLADAFAARRPSGAFIPFIMAGDPDLSTTTDLIVALAEGGATAIEVGVPFSDPVADGPVIQSAAGRALARGVTVNDVLNTCAQAKARIDVPIVLFSYANPLMQYGVERLAARAGECGIAGLLLTDVPVEHAEGLGAPFRAVGVDLIQLVAPTSSEERLQKIAAQASGFIYAVSRTGVTGEQRDFSVEASALVARVRRFTRLPVVLGFGISTRSHFRQACAIADGAVIGSALVHFISDHADSPSLVPQVRAMVAEWTSPAV